MSCCEVDDGCVPVGWMMEVVMLILAGGNPRHEILCEYNIPFHEISNNGDSPKPGVDC